MRLLPLAFAVLLVAAPAHAQQRALRWPSIDITAHLDADGRLRVEERQTIRLSGNWNGPERRFSVPFGQKLTLTGFTRTDPSTGSSTPMRLGELDAVNEYRWMEGPVLRWRSRLPSDPPHRDDTLIYTIELLYERVLQLDDDGGYVLAHDFAFADRNEPIEHFTVALTVDPAFSTPADFTGRYEAGPLSPGRGYVVRVPLTVRAGHQPRSVVRGASPLARQALGGAVVAIFALLLLRLIAHERRTGRFAASPTRGEITREWLDREVFAYPPEVVGTAWDDSTSAPEVAATIARLIADGKMRSEVKQETMWIFKRDDLQLELLVPRKELSAHDRVLIDALFSSGSSVTSTAKVRERYKSTGFDPAALITPGIKQRLDATVGLGGTVPAPRKLPTFLLFVAGLAVIVAGVVLQVTDVLALAGVAACIGVYVLIAIQAAFWQRRVERPALHLALRVAGPLLAAGLAFSAFLAGEFAPVSAVGLLGLSIVACALALSVTNIARARQDPRRLAVRKRLAAARRVFADELRKPQPALLDSWFPWVLAFGLGRQADVWFKAFGAAGSGHNFGHHTHSDSFGSGGRSGAGGWSGFGGGGGFAGAGSSASFAAAIGGMAASVPSPSSSGSSGGGGGGGGGSSGGGGGGGW